MNYGYIRTRKDVKDRKMIIQNYSELLRSCGAEKIIVETDGSELENLLKILKPNDSIYVYSIDRLTRSASKMAELFDYFEKNSIALYEGKRRLPSNLNEYLLMSVMAQASTYYYNEEDENGYEEEYEDKEETPDDLVGKFYALLDCKTSHAARKIIDSIPENKLKHLALFLHGKYYDLLTITENE